MLDDTAIDDAGLPSALRGPLAAIAARAATADRQDATLAIEIEALRAAGALGNALPRSLSGRAGWADDPVLLTTILRAVGRANLAVGRLYEGHVNAAQLIALYGSAALRDQTRRDANGGALLGVWGADGSDPVFATRQPDGYRLAGHKDFCSGLGLVRTAVLSATVDGGTLLLAANVEDPARADATCWRMSGMRATASGSYDFTDLELKTDAVMGEVNDYYREPYFLGGMYRMGAVQVGGLEALLNALADHVRRRGQGGDPLQHYRLGKCASYLLMARAVVERVATQVSRAADPAQIGIDAVLMREGVESAATEIFQLVERAAGTAAHREGTPLERIRRDLGLYLRQGAIDIRLKAVGARLAEA